MHQDIYVAVFKSELRTGRPELGNKFFPSAIACYQHYRYDPNFVQAIYVGNTAQFSAQVKLQPLITV